MGLLFQCGYFAIIFVAVVIVDDLLTMTSKALLLLESVLFGIIRPLGDNHVKLICALWAFFLSQICFTVQLWHTSKTIRLITSIVQICESALLLANVLSLLFNYSRFNYRNDSKVSTLHLSLSWHSLPINNVALVEIVL